MVPIIRARWQIHYCRKKAFATGLQSAMDKLDPWGPVGLQRPSAGFARGFLVSGQVISAQLADASPQHHPVHLQVAPHPRLTAGSWRI